MDLKGPTACSIFLVQVEQKVPEHHASIEINNDDKKGIEAAGADQHLIEPVSRVPIDVANVVQTGQTDLIQI